jgi:hypothetical protein
MTNLDASRLITGPRHVIGGFELTAAKRTVICVIRQFNLR